MTLQPEQRRQRIVIVALIVGATLVGATLRLPRGGVGFYFAGYALAGVWVLATAISATPPRHGVRKARFDISLGIIVGAVMFGVFVLGAEIGSRISVLAGPIANLLDKADAGPVLAVLALAGLNGVAEELFFRGVLIDAIGGRRAAVVSVVAYVAVTAVAGNTALTLAALVMGVVFTAERMFTGRLFAPIVTHLVWSALMILALPR